MLLLKLFLTACFLDMISLTANLLPFQVEGFSWMRHQEVKCPEIRGGILADEMGMCITCNRKHNSVANI